MWENTWTGFATRYMYRKRQVPVAVVRPFRRDAEVVPEPESSDAEVPESSYAEITEQPEINDIEVAEPDLALKLSSPSNSSSDVEFTEQPSSNVEVTEQPSSEVEVSEQLSSDVEVPVLQVLAYGGDV